MRITALIGLIATAATTQPAYCMTYYLTADLGVNGMMHMCKYSNGKLYSFNATNLCPLSIEEEGPPTNGGMLGFKVGEYQDGMTKVCVYQVTGNNKAIRIGAAELCPLSHNF